MSKQWAGACATAAVVVLLLPSLVTGLTAQCADWAPGAGVPGVAGTVHTMVRWDPDGAGPEAELLVLGGQFSIVGDQRESGVVAYSPATSSFVSLASGVAGTVYSLAVDASGTLLAGGDFSIAAVPPFAPLGRLARWDGTSWTPYADVAGTVRRLLFEPNGDLVIAGEFAAVDGVAATNVARRAGGVWSPLGSGTNQLVRALARLPGGDLVVGGHFVTAGGSNLPYLARWNGSSWSSFGGGPDGLVTSLLTTSAGELLVGGHFGHVAGVAASGIARWNGSTWSPLGAGTAGGVYSMCEAGNGELYVGGEFATAGGVPASNFAKWNGSAWSQPGSGTTSPVHSLLEAAGGALYVGGGFLTYGQPSAVGVGRYQGAWSPLTASNATGGPIRVLHVDAHGVAYAAGTTNVIGGTGVASIARRVAGVWSALGTWLDGPAHSLVTLPNGDVVVGGEFTHAGGVAAAHIARWNGATWSPLAAGSTVTVRSMVVLPGGDLLASGTFPTASGFATGLARWDGAQWSALPPGQLGVHCMHVAANGDLLVGGYSNSGAAVLRFDGIAWTQLGGAMGGNVLAVTELPDGSVVAGGMFSTAGGGPGDFVARWNGTTWLPMPGGPSYFVDDLAVLPGGDLIAAGRFVGEGRILRWRGGVWSQLGTGLDGTPRALAVADAGELLVGGEFTTADGAISAYLASYRSSCPASVTTVGVGCAGSGGLTSYTATSLPWLGATFRAHGSGLPASAFVLTVTGLSSMSLPLGSLLQPAPPQCTLLVSPDLLAAAFTNAGAIDTQWPVPVAPALVGASLQQQIVVVEVDASLQFVEWTSSNALTATLGDF